jgi:Tol biopolymer transport system component
MIKGLLLSVLGAAVAWGWTTPVNLGSPINTSYRESEVTITGDGTYLIISSNRPGGAGNLDLWCSTYAGDAWATPVNMGDYVNTASHDHYPFLAENDTKLYFSSNVAAGGYGGYDVWWAQFSNGSVGPRNNLGTPVNSSSNDRSPVLSENGQTMFFASDRPGGCFGQLDIWYSVKYGPWWSDPINLGYGVNGADNEGPVWLSADGDTLVFVSDRAGGSYGGYDFWYVEKSGSVWQNPVNLGPVINSSTNEGGATFYNNYGEMGGVMYFGSRRSGGYGETDIWETTEAVYARVAPTSLGRVKAIFR